MASGSGREAPHGFPMEDEEKEAPTSDALTDVDPLTREGELVRIMHHSRA